MGSFSLGGTGSLGGSSRNRRRLRLEVAGRRSRGRAKSTFTDVVNWVYIVFPGGRSRCIPSQKRCTGMVNGSAPVSFSQFLSIGVAVASY